VSADAAQISSGAGRLREASSSRRSLSARFGEARLGWPATVGALCFAVTAYLSRYLFWDSYLDLTGGRYVAHHGIPRHEALTTAAQRNWIDQQWLAHWIYYEVWTLGGYPLVAAVSSLLVASAFALLCALLLTRGVPAQRAFLWTLIAFIACFGNTVIRAQSFAYPLFVLLLWAILADSRRPRARFLLVIPLLILWSNLHGTVLLGIMLVVGYSSVRMLLAARARRLDRVVIYGTAVVGAFAALSANPYGVSIVDYYRALIGNPVVAHYIVEWAPPSLGNLASFGFFAVLFIVIAVTAYGIGRGCRPTPTLVAIVSFLTLLAAQGVRYQAWFAMAGAVLAAETLAAVRPSPPELAMPMQRLGALAILLAGVGAVGVLSRTSDRTFESLVPRGAMSAAAAYVETHPRAKILADDQTSSALLWLYPQTLGHVAFDARLEQYPHGRLRSWFTYLNTSSPGWPTLAARYDVVVASRAAHPSLVTGLEKLTGWRTIAADKDGVALVREH
jgi:hypothetical protein